MLYLTYTDYHSKYGGLLTEQQYSVFGARASGTIDRLTLGRAEPALAEHPDLAEPLGFACFQIADTLHSKYMALQRAVRGRHAPPRPADETGGSCLAQRSGFRKGALRPAAKIG